MNAKYVLLITSPVFFFLRLSSRTTVFQLENQKDVFSVRCVQNRSQSDGSLSLRGELKEKPAAVCVRSPTAVSHGFSSQRRKRILRRYFRVGLFSTFYVHSRLAVTVKVHPAGPRRRSLAYVMMSVSPALGGGGVGAAARWFGSAVAVFESPLGAKQTARLHTRPGLSATDSAVETAVTRPQATTAPTVAKGRGGQQRRPGPRRAPAML